MQVNTNNRKLIRLKWNTEQKSFNEIRQGRKKEYIPVFIP